MKRIFALFMVAVAAIVLVACKTSSYDIGIAMPTTSSSRWISDGDSMKKAFEDEGYKVSLQYGQDSVQTQLEQVQNFITQGVKVIIIASIDSGVFTDVLKQAKENDIVVIAYDRLIMGTADVDYYATFDNEAVGRLQAESLVKGLEEKHGKLSADKPLNIELFAGSPDDNNIVFNFKGSMGVLQPLLDAKKLVVQSGEVARDTVATLRWDGVVAQTRMENLLTRSYQDKIVHGILSPYDGISNGVLSAVKSNGYSLTSTSHPLPIITGQDAEKLAVQQIINGEIYSTVFKDTRELGKKTVQMAIAALKGEKVEVNDTTTYDTGKKVVPSYLLEPVTIDINNWESVLIGSGYYQKTEFTIK